MQTFKQAMRASTTGGSTPHQQLCSFLLNYRNTPHTTTGESPSMLFLKRPLRTRLDLLRPKLGDKVRLKQATQITGAHRAGCVRQFTVGERVGVRDFRVKGSWRSGVIKSRTGPVSYSIQLDSGELWRRHVDHIKGLGTQTGSSQDNSSTAMEHEFYDYSSPSAAMVPSAESTLPRTENGPQQAIPPSNSLRRYPQRNRRPVDRFTY